MTRNEALQHVAEHLIGYLNGSAPDESEPGQVR